MAAEAPIEVPSVRDEERLFGGDIVWWLLLLVISVPAMLFGLSQSPEIHGFVILTLAGTAAGVAFAQIALRLPYLTGGFVKSWLIVIVALTVIAGVAFLYSLTLPVPTAPPDVLYKPPVSGG